MVANGLAPHPLASSRTAHPASLPSAVPAPILPILEHRAEIEEAVRRHQVTIVCGETGSGKTTQLPQIVHALGLPGAVACTQPRRLAARAVAARIAEERGVPLGGEVGVKVRFQDQTGRSTRIKLLTDGMLLAELSGDPDLRQYGAIIIDEAHERSLNIDFLLGYAKLLLPRRSELRLIVTSATIDTQRLSAFFGGPGVAPVIEVSGRTFPVDVRYHPSGNSGDGPDAAEVDFDALANAVEEVLPGARAPASEGDVLVFLPGEREIRVAADTLRRRGIDADILPLFSRLTNEEQDRIFHPGPNRRVILATNIAETSLTVPRIRFVVDTGLARLNRYDAQRKVQRLPVEPISRASARQRSGRCGRIAAGICIRLYEQSSYDQRPEFTDPEIRRTNLANAILQMKSLGLGLIASFPFLDPPDAHAIRDGYETLFELGALESAEPGAALTPLGVQMSRIPADARIARMLLAAQDEGSLAEILVLAGALSIQDPRSRPHAQADAADRAQTVFRDDRSDFITLLKLWDQYRHAADTLTASALRGWCRDHFLSHVRMREWGDLTRQFARVAEDMGLRSAPQAASPDQVHRTLLTGLITHVACREGESGSFDYRGVRGNTVNLFPGSVLFKKGPKWIVAAEVVHTTRLYARTVARIEPEWIEELAGHMFKHQRSDRHFDAETGLPSAWERVTMSGIVVVPRRRTSIVDTEPAAARGLFIREGLVGLKWETPAPFMQHNRGVLEHARSAEAKLRRRGLLASPDQLAAWFEARLPSDVRDPKTCEKWLAHAGQAALSLSPSDVLTPQARAALDPAAFPDTWTDGALSLPLEYALSPGRDEDGLTISADLPALAQLSEHRSAWLVPGLLPECIAALIKLLPKPQRASLEAIAPAPELALTCAGLMTFAQGPLPEALSEAIEVLHAVRIDPALWQLRGLPPHLRPRFRVVDDTGKELASDRDLTALRTRFEARIRKAQQADALARFERTALTSWSFGDLPESVEIDRAGQVAIMYPALVDAESSVSLRLFESRDAANAAHRRGLRRLFALAAADEVSHALTSRPDWNELARQYSAFGPAEALRAELVTLIADRTFLGGKSDLRAQAEFDERQQSQWGRLGASTREVADIVAEILAPRAKVAQRLSGGTPRLWASSIADLREHAAYLMPPGFLTLVPWERLRNYPRYAEGMRQRLFALREEGSSVETTSLALLAPQWKRFTGWVARAMADTPQPAEQPPPSPAQKPRTKAPLPQAKRAAPVVNLDAGLWAMLPGNLPPPLDAYRWALEELRVSLFTPDLALKPATTPQHLDRLWAQVTA